MKFLLKDHPRLRGEYVPLDIMIRHVPGSPPLARGIQGDQAHAGGATGITPACAGNTYSFAQPRTPIKDHPLLRGEYDSDNILEHSRQGSPPLARGILLGDQFCRHTPGITPACAGNTLCVIKAVSVAWDHPRLRGEYTLRNKSSFRCMGSPPLARGIH